MSKCSPDELALKSFFLGPQAENGEWLAEGFQFVLDRWFKWRRERYPQDGRAISKEDQNSEAFAKRRLHLESLVGEILSRFEAEVPKFSPRYIGHMFSEISLPALFGHCIALLHNPNNISGESSRVGVEIEAEAVGELLTMCGFDPRKGTGHFTSGGTIANFEAAIRARHRLIKRLTAAGLAKGEGSWRGTIWEASLLSRGEVVRLAGKHQWQPQSPYAFARGIEKAFGRYEDPVILAPAHRHYSWEKIAAVLGFGAENLIPVELDAHGVMNSEDLRGKLEFCRSNEKPVAMVVSVAGTTELGLIDPIRKIAQVINEFSPEIWHHVDAAYGGFFCTLKSPEYKFHADLEAIPQATSLTIDPHKLGYVPFASGAFLISDRSENEVNVQPAAYIDFTSDDKGHFTLEGSRSAAGALATWLTAKAIGLNPQGYGKIVGRTIRSAEQLRRTLRETVRGIRIAPSDTNILCFCVGQSDEALSSVNTRTQRIYERFSTRKNSPFYVSKTSLAPEHHALFLKENFPDWTLQAPLSFIRVCLMNPFFTSTEPSINYSQAFAEELLAICEEGTGSPV